MTTTRNRQHRRHCIALAAVAVLDAPLLALALPQGGQVVEGQVTIGAPAAGQLGITQGSARAVVDWRSFGIGANERVSLSQPAGGAALFRVTGSDPSQIFGSLSATGALFLSNPNGVLFGAGARVDVGSLAATTLGMANADFMAGRLKLSGNSRASVVNEGHIEASPGGSVVLVGASVSNSGMINAPQGSVALGAGSAATLDVYGNGLLRLNLTAGAEGARIDHTGTVTADGGTAAASAQGAASVLNIGGVVRARSLERRDGAIYLSGGAGSQLQLTGTLDASAGAGGTNGGRIEVGAERITVDNVARLQADGAGAGNGGTVNAIATDAMDFAGAISARGGAAGGDGGQAEVSGYRTLTMSGGSDLFAPAGRTGTLLLDPGSVSIINSAGNQNGPNQFGDANLATLLGTNSVTISTANAAGGGAQTLTVASDVDVTWSAATTLTLDAGQSITMFGPAVLRNTNAGAAAFDAIVLRANTANTPTTTNTSGIGITGGAVLETSRGNIRLTGRGGSTGNFNQGVLFQGAAGNPVTVRTANGAISITGTGGADASAGNSRGISIENAATIEATGSGSVSLVGNGATGSTQIGVALHRRLVDAAHDHGCALGQRLGHRRAGRHRLQRPGGGPQLHEWRHHTDRYHGELGYRGHRQLRRRGDARRRRHVRHAHIDGQPHQRHPVQREHDGHDGRPAPDDRPQHRSRHLGFRHDARAVDRRTERVQRRPPGDRQCQYWQPDRQQCVHAGSGHRNARAGQRRRGRRQCGDHGRRRAPEPRRHGWCAARRGAVVERGERGVHARHHDPHTGHLQQHGRRRGADHAQRHLGGEPGHAGRSELRRPAVGQHRVWRNPVTSAVNPTGNRYSFALAPTIFIDAGAASKVYGDTLATTVALNNAPIATVANTFGGVFTDYTGATLGGSYTRTSAGLAATANAGTYTDLAVTNAAGVTSSLLGYAMAVGATGTVTVDKRNVTLTPMRRPVSMATPTRRAARPRRPPEPSSTATPCATSPSPRRPTRPATSAPTT